MCQVKKAEYHYNSDGTKGHHSEGEFKRGK